MQNALDLVSWPEKIVKQFTYGGYLPHQLRRNLLPPRLGVIMIDIVVQIEKEVDNV